MEGDFTWGGKLTIQCTDDAIQNYIPETSNFINQCHPNTFNQNIIKNLKGKF